MTDEAFAAFVAGLKADPEVVRQRLADASPKLIDGLHGAIGLAGEAGELLDIYKRWLIYGQKPDRDHVLEECGDSLHYLTYTLMSEDFTHADARAANVEKLRKRYPEGFTEEAAIERADKDPDTDDKRA